LSTLTLEDFKKLHPAFEADITTIWDFEKSIENRNAIGGTSKATVLQQISTLKDFIKTLKKQD
jgi:argininosuccinate lyase